MAARTRLTERDSSIVVLARAWANLDGNRSRALARQVLRLDFSEADRKRMLVLSARGSDGSLSPAEATELDGFVRAGDLIAIVRSAARRRLKAAQTGINGHG